MLHCSLIPIGKFGRYLGRISEPLLVPASPVPKHRSSSFRSSVAVIYWSRIVALLPFFE